MNGPLLSQYSLCAPNFVLFFLNKPPRLYKRQAYRTESAPVAVVNLKMHFSTMTCFLNIIISISYQEMEYYLLKVNKSKQEIVIMI